MIMLSRARRAPARRFDRRSKRQRDASERLVPALVLAGACYLAVEPLLTRRLPDGWGEVAAMVMVGSPLGALWAVAQRDAGVRAAWKTGGLFALTSALLYRWVFSGGLL